MPGGIEALGPHSTLELVQHDPTANAPERDLEANPPELDASANAPQVYTITELSIVTKAD